jgi:O-antigen/teichoic acid export membrane protein
MLRAGPGIVNLIILGLFGKWLSVADYGIYSTIVAGGGFAANLVFGPLIYSIISQHARLQTEHLVEDFQATLVICVVIASFLLGLMSLILFYAGYNQWLWIFPVIAIGSYTVFQEILHAQVRFYAYGIASFSQSIVLLALSFLVLHRYPDYSTAVLIFSASYAISSVFSLYLCGFPSKLLPKKLMIRHIFKIGTGYTISILAENCLYMGFRLLSASIVSPTQNGIVAFSIDLSQRLVGFVINLVGFAVVPRAFKKAATTERHSFINELLRGAALSSVLAALSVAAVLLTAASGRFTTLSEGPFEANTFILISAAVVMNRLKKLIIDPIALRDKHLTLLWLSYSVGALTIVALFGGAYAGIWPVHAGAFYLAGYAVATIWALLSQAVRLRV